MQPEKVEVRIAGKSVTGFLGYEADSNVLIPADIFSFRLADVRPEFKEFDQFQLFINDQLEMTGVVDHVELAYEKGHAETVVTGRDLMGLVVDSSVMPAHGDLNTLKNITVKELAKKLLKNIPFINLKAVVHGKELPSSQRKPNYHKASGPSLFPNGINENPHDIQLTPGESIFKTLSDFAQRNGHLFWCNPDGTFVFDTLKDSSTPAVFSFYLLKPSSADPRATDKNNILRGRFVSDGSKRYSTITVLGHWESLEGNMSLDYNPHSSATDSTVPFYKPLLLITEASSIPDCKQHVEWEIKKRATEAFKLEYTVAGHSQNGVNYMANSICSVKDEKFGLNGNYLILGRKFIMDKIQGQKTILTIGKIAEGYSVA